MDNPINNIGPIGAFGAPDPEPIDPMDTALQSVGFDIDATRERLRNEGFESFDDLKSMKEKDI